ncbi:hypothetical protein [Oceanibaculum indicum]|uniref:Uncharacterized protein n=1 Tax=Oceanibaculum indicum TaxID=526216 RepID=A0A420WGL0_9PROT|nr:hypothetical protein [Oceanibaculum indicum]RKQ70138.1 hypothetical protein BCL74_2078 [Oceanibaculum indicum]
MSREFAPVSPTLWRSAKWRSLKTEDARVMFLYLITNTHVSSIGCYALPMGYAATDLRWAPERVTAALTELCDADLIGHDAREELVRVVKYLRHSPIANSKHGLGAIRVALALPESPQKRLVCRDLLESPYCSGNCELIAYVAGEQGDEIETHGDGYASPMDRPDKGAGYPIDRDGDGAGKGIDRVSEPFPKGIDIPIPTPREKEKETPTPPSVTVSGARDLADVSPAVPDDPSSHGVVVGDEGGGHALVGQAGAVIDDARDLWLRWQLAMNQAFPDWMPPGREMRDVTFGGGIALSLLLQWQADGIALDFIRGVIDEAVASAKDRGKPIGSFRYFERAVQGAVLESRQPARNTPEAAGAVEYQRPVPAIVDEVCRLLIKARRRPEADELSRIRREQGDEAAIRRASALKSELGRMVA